MIAPEMLPVTANTDRPIHMQMPIEIFATVSFRAASGAVRAAHRSLHSTEQVARNVTKCINVTGIRAKCVKNPPIAGVSGDATSRLRLAMAGG
jgi:hypothetical protein